MSRSPRYLDVSGSKIQVHIALEAVLITTMTIENNSKLTPFGKAMREHWRFADDFHPINHG